MTACARPGCPGEIEAGYCNVCGHRAPAPAAIPASELPPTPAPPAGARGCARPNCDGSVGADGYCDRCGLAAPSGPTAAPGAVGSTTLPSRGTSTLRRPGGSSASRVSGVTGSGATAALGRGLVEMPQVPVQDPRLAVLDNPEVLERRRFSAAATIPSAVPEGPDRRVRKVSVRIAGRRTRSRPSSGRAISSEGSTWSPGALPTGGWGGSIWPGQERRGRMGRPQGPARCGGCLRHGCRGGREAVLGRGPAPQHRADLQLRAARGRRVHRDGVRRW